VALKDGAFGRWQGGTPTTQPNVDIIIGPGPRSSPAKGASYRRRFRSTSTLSRPSKWRTRSHFRVTTCFGGGTGPAHGTARHHLHPGPWHYRRCCRRWTACDEHRPSRARANAKPPGALIEMVNGGPVALKLHEDWGTPPPRSIAAFVSRTRHDVQVMIHTDTLNWNPGFVETYARAIKGGRSCLPHRGRRAPRPRPSSRFAAKNTCCRHRTNPPRARTVKHARRASGTC